MDYSGGNKHREEVMKVARWYRRYVGLGVIGVTTLVLWGCGGGDGGSSADQVIPLTVPKASCGPNDQPETDLQGQVSATVRAAGCKGFNCNLHLVTKSKGDGGSWQHAFFQDKAGPLCNFFDTSSATANRTQVGAVVVDATNPANPTPTDYLITTSMIDPWESLKVNG